MQYYSDPAWANFVAVNFDSPPLNLVWVKVYHKTSNSDRFSIWLSDKLLQRLGIWKKKKRN